MPPFIGKKTNRKYMTTKIYKVLWNRDDYGYILIKAKSEEDARKKFKAGLYREQDLIIKGGAGIQPASIKEQ